MAAIKSHTDTNQSRELAKILPIESADMYYGYGKDKPEFLPVSDAEVKSLCIPCWSLAALLNLLPNEIITDNRFECHYQIDIRKYDVGDNTILYQIAYGNDRGSSGSWHDMINTGEKESLIDCCVQMIINLKERNLI